MKNIIRMTLTLVISLISCHAVSAQSGKIAFAAGSPAEIFKMNRNGSGITNLTNNPARDDNPSLSADGTKIAFTSYRDDSMGEIYIMNEDGSEQTRLTFNPGADAQPALSKDGQKIVFVSRRDNATTLFLMDANGNNQTRFSVSTGAGPNDPSFSPDGSKIVFSTSVFSNETGTSTRNIWLLDLNTSISTQLTHVEPAIAFGPSFSPDGTRIVFWSSEDGGKICIVSSAGGSHSPIANSTNQNGHPTFSPDGSKIAFTKVVNNAFEVWTMDPDGSNQIRLSSGLQPSWGGAAHKPVMIIPGIAGTYSSSLTNDTTWLLNRGVLPAGLQIDPLALVYNDLIQTFENLGYVRDKDLFVVNYDWRLPPGPLDGAIDGTVSGISATSISDQQFDYGVDYLGVDLRRACERWEQDHPGRSLDEVDIVAHSTGGLVARTYIQSPAYNATFTSGKKLPLVRNLLMVGVPNRGASKAWNPINDNWNVEQAYQLVLSKIVNRAYQKVLDGCGGSGCAISGPDHTITKADILDAQGNPSHVKFIDKYVPTMRALLATYDFADFGSGFTNINGDPNFSNDWILDLNNGFDYISTADPSPFANKCAPTVIYTDSHPTPTYVKREINGGTEAVLNFDDYIADDVPVGMPWFMEIPGLSGGDGTVPVLSATGQFIGDNRVILERIIAPGSPDHTGLMSNFDAEKVILQTMGAQFQDSNISFGHAKSQDLIALSVTFDPVDGFVVDGAGRRLGFSESTGPITEIPGSVWFGDADGMGWVFGPVQEPLRLELTGRGEPYYVIVSVETDQGNGGVVDSGFLALGGTRSLPIVVGSPQDTTPPVVAPSVIGTLGNNGWYTSNVGVSWTVTDAESGVSSQNGCEVQNVTADTAGVTFTCSATSGGGTASASVTIKRDATAPTLSPTVTPDPVLVGGTANASANASDNLSGLASQSCGTPDTSTAGAKSVGCSAADNAGNIGIANANYTVSNGGYNFSGFFQPVDNLPVLNEVKAGSAIPVKFSLGGNFGLNIFATGYPASGIIACNSSSPADVVEETVNAGGSSLNYDAATGRYHYVWKTDQSWKGQCRMLIVKLKDGNTYIAQFRFK